VARASETPAASPEFSQITAFRPSIVIDYLMSDPALFDIEGQLWMAQSYS
jgi:hypothetical protein